MGRCCVLKCYKRNLKAFTLLETLVALFVISLSVLVMQAMTTLISQEFKNIRKSDEREWQNFCNLLRQEFEGAKLDNVQDNFLYLMTDNGIRRYGVKAGSDDFRKTNAGGQGYHPLIFGISSSVISVQKNIVVIRLIFRKGDERLFIYALSSVK